MAEKEFKIFSGEFTCKKCDEVVTSIRLWVMSGDTTWMCSNKHISKVSLVPDKKKKKDF